MRASVFLLICILSVGGQRLHAGQYVYLGDAFKSQGFGIKPKSTYLVLPLRDPDLPGYTQYGLSGLWHYPTLKKGLPPRFRDLKTISYKYSLGTGQLDTDEFYFLFYLDTDGNGYWDSWMRIYARKTLFQDESYGQIVTVTNLMKDGARRVQFGAWPTAPSSSWVTIADALAIVGNSRVTQVFVGLENEDIRPDDNTIILGEAAVLLHTLKIGSSSMNVSEMSYVRLY